MTGYKQLCFHFLIFFCCWLSQADEYYVSVTDGNDSNPGTLNKPFQSIQKAVGVIKPGDTVFIREGRYPEEVSIRNLLGEQDKKYTFQAYQKEIVILDGTKLLKLNWKKYKGSIYVATLEEEIWQLFADGEMQVNARWPNAFWHDFSVFDYKRWGFSSKSSTYDIKTATGVMTDNGTQDLAKSGLNATNAIAILNIGSWVTWAGLVESHTPGENSFNYNLSIVKPQHVSFNAKNCRYFLEDKLEFLDAPTEWFYDKTTQQLYLWTESGDSPENYEIRGKISTYAFTVTNSSGIIFSGLNFFGTTVYMMGANVFDIKLDSLHFSYPSYSKRMLGSLVPPNTTTIFYNGPLKSGTGNFTIFNCTWEYADGQTMSYRGADGIIENNLWHHNDFTCVGGDEKGMLFASQGIRDRFIRNVIHSNGPAEGYKPGIGSAHDGGPIGSLARLNMFYDLKNLQNDGSHVQVNVPAQNGVVIEYNWSFETPKRGLRFDCVDFNVSRSVCGSNGTMKYNIIWNTTGMSVKGDHHTISNNLIFNTMYSDLYLRGTPGSSDAFKGENEKTSTTNNIIQNGACSARNEVKCDYPVPGQYTDNAVGDVHQYIRDPNNFDFRPKPNSDLISKAIGPYGAESMSHGGTYWIPGRQQLSACTPIPPNGTKTAKCDADLMWLAGYQASSHNVYFGESRAEVENADPLSAISMKMPSNVVTPSSSKLKPATPYFWRVDAISTDGAAYTGEVWEFQCY